MPQALGDLSAIRRHIAHDNPTAAREWVSKLQHRANAAATAPLAGRVVPELQVGAIREVFLGRYRIVYRVVDDELHVLTVFDGRRLFPGAAVDSGDDS